MEANPLNQSSETGGGADTDLGSRNPDMTTTATVEDNPYLIRARGPAAGHVSVPVKDMS